MNIELHTHTHTHTHTDTHIRIYCSILTEETAAVGQAVGALLDVGAKISCSLIIVTDTNIDETFMLQVRHFDKGCTVSAIVIYCNNEGGLLLY